MRFEWIVDHCLLADPCSGCAEKLLFPAHIMGVYGKAAAHPMWTQISGLRESWVFLADPPWRRQVIFLFSWKRSDVFLFNQLCSCAVCLCWFMTLTSTCGPSAPHGASAFQRWHFMRKRWCENVTILLHNSSPCAPVTNSSCQMQGQTANKVCSRHYFVSWKLSFAQIGISQTPPNFRSEEWA